jgi:UDP-N-acetylmuramate--alanine ligase
MEIKDIKAVYFVGAGGIGMSAIARYFLSKKLVVAGYDKTPSNLTHELEKEGMLIHYEENVDLIPEACKDARNTLVVYTPAIPAEHKELVYFRENGFTIEKRAQVLGSVVGRNCLALNVIADGGEQTALMSELAEHII